MEYGVSSRHYLQQARKLLDENTSASLFYAAFELRCGIEARMQQYIETQEDIFRKKKSGWQIAKLAKDIEKMFKTGDKIVQVKIKDFKTKKSIITVYYTPVNSKLQQMGKKLGDYLHAAKKYLKTNDKKWVEMRKNLEEVYNELAKANKGTLLGPPLLSPKNKQIYFNTEVKEGENSSELIKQISNEGKNIIFDVNYFEEFPS